MKGKIYTYTIVYSAAEAFKDEVPYALALVDEDGGERRLARIQGYREGVKIDIGMPVESAEQDRYNNLTYRLL